MYTEFYRLRGLPFQLTPDPRFFFGSAGHTRAMAHLTYGLHQAEGFIVITGEVGTGKTTLVDLLLSQLDTSAYAAAKIVTSQLGGDDTLRMVAASFGFYAPGMEKAAMLRRIEEFVVHNLRARKRTLLIIDEAQNLSIAALEELRMLSNFGVGATAPLQSFLVGQPQFRTTMASPELEQLRQRVTASYHLGPLSEAETKAYVLHRLKTVGWQDDPMLSEDAFTALHRHSDGVPRRINTLASRLLLWGYLEERHAIDGDAVTQVAEELQAELVPASLAGRVRRRQRRRAHQRPRCAPGGDHRPGLLARADHGQARARHQAHDRDHRELCPGRVLAMEQAAGIATAPSPAADPPAAALGGLRNAMTVDVEDYFQVQAFADIVSRDDWDSLPRRVEHNTNRLLEIFAGAGIKATFFTLGWVAERHPALIRRITADGHELASHGYSHRRADQQTPAEFRADVSKTKAILEDAGGMPVGGYRAATFSIGTRNWWAFEVLAEAGYAYSSSIYPIAHDLYGMPECSRTAFRDERSGLVEIPLTTVRCLGRNFPCAGGGYFRLLPYGLSRWAMRRVNREDKLSCIFYMHPWEIDPGQPRQRGASWKSRLRHYTNLGKTEGRLRRLLGEFAWDRMDRVFAHAIARTAPPTA